MDSITYTVTGMTCEHCVKAITAEVSGVTGVAAVAVDLAAGTVAVTGSGLDDTALQAAIDEAGYEVAQ